MTNTKLLEQAIKRSGLKKAVISERVGLRPQSFRNKVKGRYEFKQGEITVLTDMLELSAEERDAIFFYRAG